MIYFKIFLIFISVLTFSFTYTEVQGLPDTYLYPLDHEYDGLTFSDMAIKYWEKQLEQYDNKTVDATDDCYLIPYKNVQFVLNPFHAPQAHYECEITTSDRIFGTLYSEECDFESVTGGYEALKKCAIENNQYARGKVVVDGEDMGDLSKYLFYTDIFNNTFTSNNPYGAKPGTYEAIMHGLFFGLKPFEPGTHHLEYSMVQIKPTHDNDYASKVSYTFHVKPE